MKRYAIYVIFLGLLIIFHSTFMYEAIKIRGVGPDFLMIGVVSIAFFLGAMAGEIAGFVTGFVADIISGGLLGLSAFTYTLIGYGVGIFGSKIYGNFYILSVFVVLISTFLKAVIMSLLGAVFIKPGFFGFFYHGKIFLEALINGIIAPLFFLIVSKVEEKLES